MLVNGKKIVQYIGDVTIVGNGNERRLLLTPVDHPNTANVTNTREALTSRLVKTQEGGTFETMNTVYVPLSAMEKVYHADSHASAQAN